LTRRDILFPEVSLTAMSATQLYEVRMCMC
jgi:hypothetical protein